jgi:membrane-bound lytic murein transglycosylase D
MNFRNTTLSIVFFSTGLFAQDNLQKREYVLDSIKNSFVSHDLAECVDQRWASEMMQSDLFQEMKSDLEIINIEDKVDFELSTELLKERLRILDSKSAFDIEYNPGLENLIKHYLKNRKRSFERLMGLSQYYFPIFEASLAKYNVPLEIKYLAIVESALNPRAVSKMGATGIWQFMFATGKQYNLDVTTFIDERSDILKSTEAACQYMVNMYAIFGDWDLVLASYNAGPGNVSKAIRRSGGKQNYWNIRPFLPKETQGYVPAFLATMYIYEFHKEHGIVPQKAVYNTLATDTIQVKRKMSFKQISEVLDIPVAEIQFLNPSYKRDFIPHIEGKPHFLRLPSDKIALLTSNEDKFYAFLDFDFSLRERPNSTMEALADADGGFQTIQKTKYHVVKKGETLGGISNKYGVSVANLKSWNGLKTNVIPVGKKLKIVTSEAVAVSKPTPVKPAPSHTKDSIKTSPVLTVESNIKLHTVEKGESLSLIAGKYETSADQLKQWNNLESDSIQIGQKLIVSTQTEEADSEEPIFTNYTVLKGDTVYTIAKKFGVNTEDVISWNQLADNSLQIGMLLKIAGTHEPASTQTVAKPVSQEKPVVVKQETHYVVKKGDSLFSISQKIPGVTVADLKKWNGISSGTVIKPGMKLKISG